MRIDEREDGSIHEAALRHGKYAVMLANAVGAVVTFSLSAWVVPIPKQGSTPQNVRENLIAFIIVLIVGMIAGTALSVRAADKASGWIRAGRLPTLDEREATLRYPVRQTVIEAMLWGGVAVVFFAVNVGASVKLGVESSVAVLIGGLTTCAITYLLVERFSRPAVAVALEVGPPARPTGPGIRARLGLTWVFGSAVPLAAVGLVGVVVAWDVAASRERIGLGVAVLALAGVLAGFITTTISARALSEPLQALRAALARIEAGELDASVTVDDAGEIGRLQSGFNRMAQGLRERERLRDLFGRHVGEEVARNALRHEDIALGGQIREAAVLFVDVIGSTSLAAEHDPSEVVARLNAFFAIVVECVSGHGGWVNKFEGDAALCVFGAPTSHPDAAGAALAAARELRMRLDAELTDLRAAIGVSAGEVVAGNVGAAERFEYTVIGDPVNEAARLSDLAKTAPGLVLASDAALARAGQAERMLWQLSREEMLRGRTRPTGIAAPR